MQEGVENTGIDGFNLADILAHQNFEDIVKFVVSELQRRGVYQTEYAEGTLRKKLLSKKQDCLTATALHNTAIMQG